MKITKYNIKSLLEFIQGNFEDELTIFVWVLMWSLLEPWLIYIHWICRIGLILLLLFLLNKRLLKFPKKRKYRKKKVTNKDLAVKIDNLENTNNY